MGNCQIPCMKIDCDPQPLQEPVQGAKPHNLQQLAQNAQDLFNDCQLFYFLPLFPTQDNQRKPNILHVPS